MKNLTAALALILMFLFSSAFISGDEKISFYENNYSKAVKQARNQDKPVFVMFSSPHCGVCRKMKKDVLGKESVGRFFNDNFVSVKIDPSSAMQNMRASNWGVKKLPAYIYLDENKNILLKSSGYKSEDDIIREGQIALKKKRRS